MDTVRKRGENQWEASVRKTGFPVSCKTFIKKAEVEAWAKMVESEMERGFLFLVKRVKAPLWMSEKWPPLFGQKTWVS